MRYVKLLRDGKGVWGVLHGDMVRTLTRPPFEGICYDGESLPLEACRLLAPCEATKIVCVGKNYYDHAVEMGEGVPEQPILFLKAPNTLNHPEGTVHAPAFVGRLDYEGELAFVIRRRAKDVKAEDFADYILGYTCLNDVTARDVQKGDGQWTRGKSMDGFAPPGPRGHRRGGPRRSGHRDPAQRDGGPAGEHQPVHDGGASAAGVHHRLHDSGAGRRGDHRHPGGYRAHGARRHRGGHRPGHRHPAQPDCLRGTKQIEQGPSHRGEMAPDFMGTDFYFFLAYSFPIWYNACHCIFMQNR